VFVLCVVSKKDKIQDNQDEETSTDEVQTEFKRILKKPKPGSVGFVVEKAVLGQIFVRVLHYAPYSSSYARCSCQKYLTKSNALSENREALDKTSAFTPDPHINIIPLVFPPYSFTCHRR
jgi:hypothetical protein